MTERSLNDRYLRVAAVALRLGVSASKVRGLISQRKLHAVRDGEAGMYRVSEASIETYLKSIQPKQERDDVPAPASA